MAQRQGIFGDVQVLVTLDQQSQIVGSPSILRSPSIILNRAAIDAARASTFQTEIRNCVPLAAQYIFVVVFQAPPSPAPGHSVMTCFDGDADARVLMAATADTPIEAQKQHISGLVVVMVSLDEHSHVVGTPAIIKSTSPLLNRMSILAARYSTYRTQFINCKPVASKYIFVISYSAPPASYATATPCVGVNAPAKVLRRVKPMPSAEAIQTGITGAVHVLVMLDAKGELVGTPVVIRSPSIMLNEEAIRVARASTYAARIVNCTPVASRYELVADFTAQTP